MRIKIDGKTPPTFTLSGSGNLVFLYLAEVHDNRRPSLDDPDIWKIRLAGIHSSREKTRTRRWSTVAPLDPVATAPRFCN